MPWYKVIKTIRGRRYHYWQRTYREGGSVKTLNKFIGPLSRDTKVLDFKGNPMPVYHGTLASFDTFDLKKVGENTGWDNARFGIFFSDAKSDVRDFVENTRTPGDDRPAQIKEAFLEIRKPLDLTVEGIFNVEEQAPLLVRMLGGEELSPAQSLDHLNDTIGLGEFADLMEAIYSDEANKSLMQEHGYDGIISQFGRNADGSIIREYVAFDPSQITILTPPED